MNCGKINSRLSFQKRDFYILTFLYELWRIKIETKISKSVFLKNLKLLSVKSVFKRPCVNQKWKATEGSMFIKCCDETLFIVKMHNKNIFDV